MFDGRLVVMTGGTSNGTFPERLIVHVALPNELLEIPVIISVELLSVPDTVDPLAVSVVVNWLLESNWLTPPSFSVPWLKRQKVVWPLADKTALTVPD
jgi:hypothetical protein